MLYLLRRCSCGGCFEQPEHCPHQVCALCYTRLSRLNTRPCPFWRQPNTLSCPDPNRVCSIFPFPVQRPPPPDPRSKPYLILHLF